MISEIVFSLPFKYMEDPIVMRNDEIIVSSYLEEHNEFIIREACTALSMDAVRVSRAMARLGIPLEVEVLE